MINLDSFDIFLHIEEFEDYAKNITLYPEDEDELALILEEAYPF